MEGVHCATGEERTLRPLKKAFLNGQCKVEENNRMGKTSDTSKKTEDIKGTFHVKIGTIKDKNSKDLTEAEDIQKRWQEYIQELYKKVLMTHRATLVWSLT